MTQNRVALLFLSAWGAYNKGDIAGFDADQAEALEAKGVAKKAPAQPTVQLASLSIELDAEAFRKSEAFGEIAAQLEAATDELNAREAALKERAAELAGREYDLDQREAAIAAIEAELGEEPGETEVVEPEAEAAPAPAPGKASGLPKQGR